MREPLVRIASLGYRYPDAGGRSLHDGAHVLRTHDAAGRRHGRLRHERYERNRTEPKWSQPGPSAVVGAGRTDRKKLVRFSTFFWNSSRER